MSSMTIKLTPSLANLKKRFASIDIQKVLDRELKILALDIEGKAKRETPVDIGGLRASIRTERQGKGFIVRPHVSYAKWIHEGKMTRGGRTIILKGHGRAGTPRGGKPFMTLGAKSAVKRFEKRLADRLGDHIKTKIKTI